MQENFIQNILLQNHKRPTAMSKPVELPFVTFHCSTQATGRMFYNHTAFSQKKNHYFLSSKGMPCACTAKSTVVRPVTWATDLFIWRI